MNENIKQYAKIGSKSLMAWIKIVVLGAFIFIICMATAIILYGDNKGPGFSGGGHAGGVAAVMGVLFLFTEEFWTALLLFGSIACFCFYLAFAGKYALHKAIQGIWSEKLSDKLMDKTSNYINALSNKQPGWMKAAGSGAKVKLQLLQTMHDDQSISSVQRRVLNYGFKKAYLQDIDFSNEHTDLGSIVTSKMQTRLDEAAQPSMKLFWIVALAQLVILILAVIYNHH